jgi:hypothetical protein
VRRNNISNQTSVLDNVFSGFPNLFGPPNTGASRNTRQNGCESKPPNQNYYPSNSPITQTNLRNQAQNAQCFHRESLLGSIFGGNIFFPPPRENFSQSIQRNNDGSKPSRIEPNSIQNNNNLVVKIDEEENKKLGAMIDPSSRIVPRQRSDIHPTEKSTIEDSSSIYASPKNYDSYIRNLKSLESKNIEGVIRAII